MIRTTPDLRYRWTWPLGALFLSAGAPLGLLLTRWLTGPTMPIGPWARAELTTLFTVYVYVTVSTAIVFAVFALQAGRRADDLDHSACLDALTGLANRRWFSLCLAKEIARCTRYGTVASLALLDVDSLKAINDRLGHAAGDEALKAVADGLRASVRVTDLAARYGGDEFALLLPETTADAARELARRCRTAIRAAYLAHGGHDPFDVAIGIADNRSPHTSPDELFAAADHALYEAKHAHHGRSSASTPAQ